MTTVTRHALRVYAALSGLKSDKDGDVLDALIPFLEPVLAAMNGTIFDGGLLALGVEKIYGWRFNRDVADGFAGRLLAKGYLERKTGNILLVSFAGTDKDNSDDIEISQILDRVVDDFEQFPPKLTDLFQFSVDRERLKDILIRFLVSFDAFTEEAFAAHVERMKLGIQTKAVLNQLDEGGRALSKEDQYLCARFVHHLIKDKPEFVPHLSRLASIGLLTEVVEDFLKPTAEAKRSDLTLILDTSVALDLLGLSGREAKADIENIIGSLRGIGCSVIVLPVSGEEMSRNLETMLAQTLPNRHGPTHSAMQKREITEDFVRSVMRDPERALNQIGVTMRPIDLTTTPSQVKFFDQPTYEDFFSGIGWKRDSIDAREHDATCAAITMRLRAGHKSSDPLNSKFVFVTTNPLFVKYARDFCRRNRMIGDRQTPPVIIQRELAMIAWLRTGLLSGRKANQIDIPRSHLIASCERVLRPRREVLKTVHDKLKEFSPEKAQQYELLLADQRSVERLMDETLGLERLASTANPEALLEEMRTATAIEITTDYERKLRATAQRHGQEKKEMREASAAELAEARAELARREAELEKLREQRRHLKADAEASRRAEVERVEGILRRTNASAASLERGMTWTIIAVAAVGTWGATVGLPQALAWGGGAVLVLIGLYHTIREIQQKPKFGFRNILDSFARFRLRRGLKVLGFEIAKFENAIDIDYGRLSWRAEERARLLTVEETKTKAEVQGLR
jgi:hypothetical protein